VNIRTEIKQERPFVTLTAEAVVSLLRTGDLVRRAVAAVVEPHGVTVQQYNVLRILRGAGREGLPTLEIAERMVEQTPGITRLLDRLETKGLVTRERCRTDRRQVFCHIAAAGLELLAKIDQPLRDAESAALSTLNDRQLAQLINLLDLTRTGLHAALEAARAQLTQEAS
jgi:DNA-binding MarR family transcriptional regulator